MSMRLLLIGVAALLVPVSAEGQAIEPYRCGAPIEIDGLSGGMWRDFGFHPNDDFYIIQLHSPDIPGGGPRLTWSIDNRPPRRPRFYGYQIGRPEAVVFEQGPDYVAFGTILYGELRDGMVRARLYGDGVYAGTIFVQSARNTRRGHRNGVRGVYVSVSQGHYPVIVAALAGAAEWRAELIDPAGRALGEAAVRVPSPARIRAEFARAKAALLRDRDAYLAAGARSEEGSPCERHPSPEETI